MIAKKKQPSPQDPDRAAIYTRVSTEDQAQEGYGLEVQRDQASQYATAYHLNIAAVFSDEGLSGTKPAAERPGLLAAIHAAKAQEYDILIVPSIDRLARRAALLLNIWDELEAAGVAIVAIKERIDTTTAAGRLMRTMFAGVAEFERDSIVARTTAGRDQRGKQDGEKGGRLPFGYIRTEIGIGIHEPSAAVVRRVFSRRREKATLQMIADELNRDQVPTARIKQGYKGIWYPSSVKVVLDNEPIYQGSLRGDSPISWPGVLYD